MMMCRTFIITGICRRKTQKTDMLIILTIIGGLCLLYYLVICLYNGPATAQCWIWLAAGFVLCASAFTLWRLRKKFRSLSVLMKTVLVSTLATLLLIFSMAFWSVISGVFVKSIDNADYVIILGAGVRGTELSPIALDRCQTALAYLNQNPQSIAIASGGQGDKEEISEAAAIRNYLIRHGISSVRIWMEDDSENTMQNIYNSLRLIAYQRDRKEEPSLVVVTSDFHMARALSLVHEYRDSGVYGLAAPSDRVLFPHYVVRETFAVIRDKIMGNIV